MAKGEVVISDALCLGCGYCVEFCPKGCIEVTGDRFSHQGALVPSFVNPEECTACGICGWMCPHFAIEVYKLSAAGSA